MEAAPLLELMTQEVARQREELLAAASHEAEQLTRQARERAERRRAETLEAVEAELSAAGKRARERAEAAAHMVLMTTKDAIADALLTEVRERLRQLAEQPQFEGILRTLLAELMATVSKDGSPLVVLAPPAHVALCQAWLAENGHGEIPVEPLKSLRDGVAIQDPARTFRTTNTLSLRFLKREGELRRFCLQELTGEGA